MHKPAQLVANHTSLYRLQQETTNTLLLGNAILTELAIVGGNSRLYGTQDKEQKSRLLLSLYLHGLTLWSEWDGIENELLCQAEVERLLYKTQQLYKNMDCGTNTVNESDSINSGNVFGGNNPSDSGSGSTPDTITYGAVKGFHMQIKVGTEGALLAAGALTYTLPYTNVVPGTVRVELPNANLPEGETDQLSTEISYSAVNTIISFTNMDGDDNIGVQHGMLLIITGQRYVAGTTGASIDPTPPAKTITGAAFSGTTYTWLGYAGYDWEIFAYGLNRPLIPEVEFTVAADGTSVTIINGMSITSEDYFRVSTNGVLSS